ncbi:aldose 1-epimerase [Paenibacillus sp. 7124]|uniref:Aldose 1-epimerase n=1 Tax=Paenibacillus apii TaxID=1850370 RepID=A0A6M1PMB2_9BACL|nr:aldose 1-epimerase [Paenibacillus apii]NGM83285.1 aldose 1-epimerase [Paenibacillus apii]NJJ38934.1 aldose 1-epimerase [Paenibacillus apii]
MEILAYEGQFEGEAAVWLKAGRYEAAVLPETGGNLIAFRDTKKGFRFLREPGEDGIEAFKQSPGVYGIPVLFPPNRYEDGKFPWNGQVYQLPVNEAATGNHLHGFLHTVAWQVEDFGSGKHESYVTVAIKVDENHPSYKYYPFEYTVKLRYGLSEAGLSQQVLIHNDGKAVMPCLLAFHTAVNAPFAPESSASDYRVKITIGKRWELSERMLPTGNYQPLGPEEVKLREEGVNPFFAPLDNHYTAVPQNGRNRMELTDTKLGVTLVYDAGTSYKQWMIWNNGATEGFFCPEPQINLVNAPNMDLPGDEIGLFSLKPGEFWEETARFYVKGL